MPIWIVAPSGIRSATNSPIRRSTSPIVAEPDLVGPDVALDCQVDVVDVDEAVAESPRHAAIELHDHCPGRANRRVHRLDARAERAEAVRIRGRRVHEHEVEREHPGLEQARHVGQERGHVVGTALVDGGAGVRTDEQRPMPEVGRHLRREMGAGALAMEVDDADGLELRRSRDERVEEHGWSGRRALEVQLVA